MAFGSAIKKSNIIENWLYQFGYFNGDAQGNGDGAFSAITQADGSANLLNEALDNSETDVDVDDGTVFTSGDHIKVDNEIMKVSSVSSNTLTVIRGAMSTTAVTHNDNTQVYWQNFLPLAFSDITYDSVFYVGAILNKPSIRESIDLNRSVSKTSNVSVTIPDLSHQGLPISQELFGGTRSYINQEVKIFSKIDGDSPVQIGSFRLIDIATDGNKITLSLTSHRPWDFITIPQAKTDKNNYFPVVYGDFTKNTSTRASQAFCSSTSLYPCPVEQRSSSYLKGLQPQLLSSDARLHIYEKEIDAFIPLTKSDNSYRDTATVDGDGHSTIIEHDLFRGFITKGFIEQGSSSNEFGNPVNAVDTQNTSDTSSSYASATATSGASEVVGSFNDTKDLYLDCPSIIGTITEGKSEFYVQRITSLTASSAGPAGTVSVTNLANADIISDFNWSSSPGSESATATNKTTLTLDNGQLPTNYGCKIDNAIVSGTYTGASATLRVYDARLYIKANLDFANNKEAAIQTLDSIDTLYCGANGLTESWSGSNGAINDIHEAHRDMLIRFAGLDTTDPDGWDDGTSSDLTSDRSGWKIRWWALEPVELKKALERMQYEGGFVFRYKSDGSPQYIHIKNSPSTEYTLSKYDISNISVKVSPYNELITKRTINYNRHPAEKRRYLNSVTTEDTTNNARGKYNIKSKENIQDISLNMLTAKITKNSDDTDTNPGNDDPNDSFAAYYNNIFGNIKLIVSFDIVNPYYYDLEVGSIIEFDENNMFPETPMGHNSRTWNNLKMIVTSTGRTPGKLSITAREI